MGMALIVVCVVVLGIAGFGFALVKLLQKPDES